MKKAIILDMDETLEHGNLFFDKDITYYIMTLRPNLKALVEKLKEIKENKLSDIILCTDASNDWVNVFFKKCPDIKDVFDKIYTRNNPEKWEYYNSKKYSVEYYLDGRFGSQKPVTTFGYDQILFVDDNTSAGRRLNDIVRTRTENNQDISFFSGFGFYTNLEKNLYFFNNVTAEDKETSKLYSKYLTYELQDPGIEYMINEINEFIKKDFEPGYIDLDDKYRERHREYLNKKNKIKEAIEEAIQKRNNNKNSISYPTIQETREYFIKHADLSHGNEKETDKGIDK